MWKKFRNILRLFNRSNKLPKPTQFEHVYEVKRGMQIEDFKINRDGFIWYDEIGLLGTHYVFTTAKDAFDSLQNYIKRNYE